ncbi:MAG: beta-lactamase family protein [Melioribacteraceae bacterium]|nr:beta-lactamase family protein [Melioribacteraceae bacterium]
MFSKKNNNFFYILLIFLSQILIFSCEDEFVEPQLSILTNENIAKLQLAADNIIRDYNTPGLAAYIAVEGEGAFTITRGVSNITTNEPMSVNNTFKIASISKTFTTEAVLILVDQGLIDLNKSIQFYLPEIKLPHGADKITVRMLGNMTSGLFNYTDSLEFFESWYATNGETGYTPQQLVAIAGNRTELNFTPGTKYEYSNTNTVLLGMLIEKVTGKKVRDVLSEKIFQPLGLVNTQWPLSQFLPYPYTHGYTYSPYTHSFIDCTNWNISWADAAGMLVSNLHDLQIWSKELIERNLLSQNSKNERFLWNMGGYGFGLENHNNWIGHPGIIEGYNSQIWIKPERKITIIITTNSAIDLPAQNAMAAFAKILN